MTVDSLKSEIRKLPAPQRAALSQWLLEEEEAEWDQQIGSDFDAGKLDSAIQRAREEHRQGKSQRIP